MSWTEKHTRRKPAEFSFAPAWFIEAVRAGKSDDELYALVRESCREAEAWDAQRKELPTPTHAPDETWVQLMFSAYMGTASGKPLPPHDVSSPHSHLHHGSCA